MNYENRKEPSLDALDYSKTGDVLSLLAQVAEEDYSRHLEAARIAKTAEERMIALDGLRKATEASTQLTKAQEYFLHSRDNFRFATVEMLSGNPEQAQSFIVKSSEQMQRAGERAAMYNSYAPTSRFLAASIAAVSLRDELATKAGQVIGEISEIKERTVASFTRGIRAFTEGMQDFAKRIRAVPAQVQEAAASAATSSAAATVSVMGAMLSSWRQTKAKVSELVSTGIEATLQASERGYSAASQRATNALDAARDAKDLGVLRVKHAVAEKREQVNEAARQVRQSAWEVIDDLSTRSQKAVVAVKSSAIDTGEKVERHARAAVGTAQLGAGVLRSLGARAAEIYQSQVEEVAEKQSARRSSPRP